MTSPPSPPSQGKTAPPEWGAFDFVRRMPPPSGEYSWVYLWERPLRFMHWISALCVVGLAVTGFYIGRPYFMTSGEASAHYLMGWVRFSHFTFAALLVMAAIVRSYWFFMGNRFERWPALFPVRARDRRNMWRMIRFYLFMHETEPKYLGHNPVQQVLFTLTYAVALLMATTGFAMYGQSNPGGLIYTLFNWVNTLTGGTQITRFIHHASAWYFGVFIPVHVYAAITADHWERTGTVSSIISGGRFVPAGEVFEDGQP